MEAIQQKVDGQEITSDVKHGGGKIIDLMEALKASLAAGARKRRRCVGTSGFAFKEWKGPFYPDDLKDDAMLGYYAVAVSDGRDQQHVLPVAAGARAAGLGVAGAGRVHFAIKASQRITHHARLAKPGSRRTC